MEIKKGGVIYYLDRSAWNVNDPEALVKKMDIIEKPKGTFAEGGLYAHAKDGYFTIEFNVNEEKVAALTKPDFPCIFETREAAQTQYDKETQKRVENILNMPHDKLFKQFFHAWNGDSITDIKIYNAMKQKILNDFGVDVSEA